MDNNHHSNPSSTNPKPSIIKSSPQLVPLSELISDVYSSINKEENIPLEEALKNPGPSQVILDQSILMGLLSCVNILKHQKFVGYLGGRWVGKVKGEKIKAVGWIKHFFTCQRSVEMILNEELIPDSDSLELAEKSFHEQGLQLIGWFRSECKYQNNPISTDLQILKNLQPKYPHLVSLVIPTELVISNDTSNCCPEWTIYRITPSDLKSVTLETKPKEWEKIGYAINPQPYTSPQILKELQKIFKNLAIETKQAHQIQLEYLEKESLNSEFVKHEYEHRLMNLSKTCIETFEKGLNNDFTKLALSKLKLKELINTKLRELHSSLNQASDESISENELHESIKQLVEYAALRPNKRYMSNRSTYKPQNPLFESPSFPPLDSQP